MLKLFGNDNYDWDTFFKIACVIKNEEGSFDVFDKWCKLSSKYDKSETTKLWESLQPIKNGFSMNTLTKLVNKKYPKLLKKKTDQYLDNITMPTVDLAKYGYETFEYEEKYCKSLVGMSKTYDTIVLKSHLGTGKTTVICGLIKKINMKVFCV